jgi:hypothetical protein
VWREQDQFVGGRRGDAVGAAPGCPFASIDIISFITMMKRE